MFVNWSDCAIGEDKVATLSCLPEVLKVVIFWALVFAGTVALFLMIFAGIRYINSGGDPKAADTARKTFTYAILGLLVILLSFFILNLIAKITGVNSITDFNLQGSSVNSSDTEAPTDATKKENGQVCVSDDECKSNLCKLISGEKVCSPF